MPDRRRSLAFVAIAVLFAAVAVAVGLAQMRSRQALEAQFEDRASLTAAYVRAYLEDLAQEHVGDATEWLGDPAPSTADVATYVDHVDAEMALVLDGDGHLLAASPPRTDLTGIDLRDRYPHLAAAAGGEVEVSGVVPAAGMDGTIVSLAVPFEVAGERRVVSAGWQPGTSPLEHFLRFARPSGDAETVIVDDRGRLVLASTDGSDDEDVDQLHRLALPRTDGTARRDLRGVEHLVAVTGVAGTPWRVVSASPYATVVAPVRGWREVVPWIVMVALAVAVVAAGWQLRRAAATERLMRLEQARANLALEAAARAKDDFIAIASHEFRTPVTVIRGMSDVLHRRWHDIDEDARRGHVATLDRNAVRLVSLVEDLLVITDLENRRRPPVIAALALCPTLEEAVALSCAGTAGVSVRCDDELTVLADAHGFQRVLVNLLDNAVKYGTPPITVDATAVDRHVEIVVADRGPGVPEHFVPELFEKFTQAATHETRSIQGSGLGLSIARALTERQGGTLTYAPNVPTGSRFTVRLPLAATIARPPSPAPAAA